jgi:hypothetical protein
MRRKLIHSQNREIVISVYSFMKKEADSGKTTNVDQIATESCLWSYWFVRKYCETHFKREWT